MSEEEDRFSAVEQEQYSHTYKLLALEKQTEETSKSMAEFREIITEKLTRMQTVIDSDRAYDEINAKQIAELKALLEKIDSQQQIIWAEKKQAQEFWRDMKAKLLTAGILGTAAILGSALIFATKEYIRSMAGN